MMIQARCLRTTQRQAVALRASYKPWTLRFAHALSSSTKSSDEDFETMLAQPTWSVRSLFQEDLLSPPSITQKQLHHLLRLSALPLPSSEAQEAKMIQDLRSQLKFVQVIQQVDTKGVEPLQVIRDETKEAETEDTITVDSLSGAFEKEEVVGMRGRIRRRNLEKYTVPGKKETAEGLDEWDPLAQAPRKMGRFFVVDTARD